MKSDTFRGRVLPSPSMLCIATFSKGRDKRKNKHLRKGNAVQPWPTNEAEITTGAVCESRNNFTERADEKI